MFWSRFSFAYIIWSLVFLHLQNHSSVIINNDLGAIFVIQAKIQLRLVNENQNTFEITLRMWRHPVKSGRVCKRSKVDFRARMTSWSPDEVRGRDFVLALTVLWKVTKALELTSDLLTIHYSFKGWRHTQSKLKNDLIFIDLAQLHFCLAYKIGHWFSFDSHTSVILQLGDDKLSIHLIKRKSWPNTPYFLI